MIDEEGERLYSEMIEAIWIDENTVSDAVKNTIRAFDKHMNALNKTTEILYSKKGDPLMKW